jgi:hypothetical protein
MKKKRTDIALCGTRTDMRLGKYQCVDKYTISQNNLRKYPTFFETSKT